jgi:hypothetical protein
LRATTIYAGDPPHFRNPWRHNLRRLFSSPFNSAPDIVHTNKILSFESQRLDPDIAFAKQSIFGRDCKIPNRCALLLDPLHAFEELPACFCSRSNVLPKPGLHRCQFSLGASFEIQWKLVPDVHMCRWNRPVGSRSNRCGADDIRVLRCCLIHLFLLSSRNPYYLLGKTTCSYPLSS